MEIDVGEVKAIVDQYRYQPDGRVSYILEAIQKKYRYLPEEALKVVADELDIPLSQLFGVATFYAAFSLEQKGEHIISVCHGTVCHVKGAKQVQQALNEILGIKEGETTPDKFVTLEEVRCLGCCSLAPVISVDGRIYMGMTASRVPEIIAELRGGEVAK